MSESSYTPEEGDVLAHPYDSQPRSAAKGTTYFSIGTGHGVGKPYFYVS